jgi:hypothetical protein
MNAIAQKLQSYLVRTHKRRLKLYQQLGIQPSQDPKWVPKDAHMPQLRDTIAHEEEEL